MMERGAWILAGGQSTRFGSDKALHPLGEETLLGRTARVCAQAGLEVTVVARYVRPGGLATLVEAEGPRHPLHGVAAALGAAAARGQPDAWLGPCDLPAVGPAQIEQLCRHAAPCYASSVRLLCLLPSNAAALASELAASGQSVGAFLTSLNAESVDVGPLVNLNLPA